MRIIEEVHVLFAEYKRSCMGVAVSAQGAGLVRAVVDHTVDFHVDTNGHRGSLKLQVDGARNTSLYLNK